MPESSNSNLGWLAELFLRYEQRRGMTRLVERKQIGPLAVQRPFYPENGISHTYLLHPPGGVVGGDQIHINVEVGPDCHSLLTTPGATKFYRSTGVTATQKQTLIVKDNGILEGLPQENIFFPNSHCDLNTHVILTSAAKFIGWEIQCFGRPTLNEVFSSGQIRCSTRIELDNQLISLESLYLEQLDPDKQSAGMRQYPMIGTLYIYPYSEDLKIELQNTLSLYQQRCNEALEYGLTDIDGLIAIRLLGKHTEPMMGCFVEVWKRTRLHWFGVEPTVPRIWAT
ncbi:TPA: urease accessory protein UreD [Photobacterium damselae]